MGILYDRLMQDIRFVEGLNSCMNCGVCSAICPAAEFYHYDPRIICDTVQSHDESEIEALLRSETMDHFKLLWGNKFSSINLGQSKQEKRNISYTSLSCPECFDFSIKGFG